MFPMKIQPIRGGAALPKPGGRLCAPNNWWMGGFVWTGFDYRGEPTPYEWPNINSHFGVMDMCGFPKNISYYYKSWWSDKDVLQVSPHWNHGQAKKDNPLMFG